MKNFLTILILGLDLVFVSCQEVPIEPPTRDPDREATGVGNSVKTPNYNFTEGFTYHEWKGTSPEIIYIPLKNEIMGGSKYYYIWHNQNPKHPVKKLVSSKFFDIYVDITEGGDDFRKATNMTDVAYDKLIRELEKYRSKIISVYGEPSNVDGNGKIEIVFHSKYNFVGGSSQSVTVGYFQTANINKAYRFTAERDVIYINSIYMNRNRNFGERCLETIIHEFQHDIFGSRNGNSDSSHKWINEALSESTYIVMYDGKKGSGSGRFYTNRSGKLEANFSADEIRNGNYFFYWTSGYSGNGNYLTASHFMYWLYIHGGGNQIIREIALSPYKVPDLNSVGNAARKYIPALRGMSDANILKTWYAANFYNSPSGIYGYKNKINIVTAKANNSGGKVVLKKGCAVYTTSDMYRANQGKKGLYIANIEKGSNDLFIFNVKNIGSGFSLPNIFLNLILVRINPNVPRMMSAQPLQEEPMWVDYAFMYGEESLTSADFKTEEDMKRDEMELIKKLEKEEREETDSDDYKAELNIIEKTN